MEQKQTEVGRLAAHADALERALLAARRELFDARSRLALIGRILEDRDRLHRAPGVTAGAISAALHHEPGNLRAVAQRYPRRNRNSPNR